MLNQHRHTPLVITHKSRQFLVEWENHLDNGKVVIVEVTSANSCAMPESFHKEIRADLINQLHIPAHKQPA